MARLITAQPKFKILVANIENAGDPSRGPSGNPVKVRTGFVKQILPELVRGATETRAPDPSTPGLTTCQGLLTYTVPLTPVGASATVTVANGNFAAAAKLYVGDFVVTSGEDYVVAAAVQATGSVAVIATPSVATITIGGTPLTATAGARTPGANDYDGTLGTPALIAADIRAAINDALNSFAAIVTAAAPVGASVTLTAVPVGAAGNAITLASSDLGDVTVSGLTLINGVNAANGTAVNLAAAIEGLPGYSAAAIGTVVTITGPFGPNGNDALFEAIYAGSVQNFTLAPSDGFLAGAEPFIGPPTILP